MLTLLIDGDILVYQVAAKCEKPAMDWGDGIISPQVADLNEGISYLTDRIKELKSAVSADKVLIALKHPSPLFRRSILPAYKANRTGNPPLLRAPLMKWLVETKPKSVMQRPGLEGDDILGILATGFFPHIGERIIWSEDKDLRQIPGKHLVLDPLAVEEVTEEQGDYLHMFQTLTGDATDNYKGLPGCGPVKAERVLSVAHNCQLEADCVLSYSQLMWVVVREAYKKAGLTEADALIQARCARILRASDYDFKRKEPILWLPPSSS